VRGSRKKEKLSTIIFVVGTGAEMDICEQTEGSLPPMVRDWEGEPEKFMLGLQKPGR
jgi:hypothetical protein